MGVNHGRAHILVPEQFLNRADVIAIFKQMGGKGLPKRVATRLREENFN